MPADDTSQSRPRFSSNADMGDSATHPSLRRGASTTAALNETEQKRAKKCTEPYVKRAQLRTQPTTKIGSTAATASSKRKLTKKVKTTNKKEVNAVTGKENRTAQRADTRRKQLKPKVLDSENGPSSDTLVAPSSPSKPKVKEFVPICVPDLTNGAYTRSPDSPRLSSPLPPSSPLLFPPSLPAAAVSTSDAPSNTVPASTSALALSTIVRKSRRLLGLRASPVPHDAPPELKTRFLSPSSSCEDVVFGDTDVANNSEEPDDTGRFDEEVHDDERLEPTLRLPADMIRDDEYTEREEWFHWKKAEYARPWDAPIDFDDPTLGAFLVPTLSASVSLSRFDDLASRPSFLPTPVSTPWSSNQSSSLTSASAFPPCPAPWNGISACTPIPSPTWSWTPTVSLLSSIAFSRSPCATLSALFWRRESREAMTDRAACADCVQLGEADMRDCEGGGIAGRRPGQDYSSMGMDVEINLDGEAEEELEDAPWCVNGARVRYDGSVVGVCRVCKIFGVSASGARSDCDDGDAGDVLLGGDD